MLHYSVAGNWLPNFRAKTLACRNLGLEPVGPEIAAFWMSDHEEFFDLHFCPPPLLKIENRGAQSAGEGKWDDDV